MEEVRKKRKLEKEAQKRPEFNEKPNGCQFFVKRKQRFCRMLTKSGHQFCVEHAVESNEESDHNRVVCPLDKTHTVFIYNLKKHLKVCNKRIPDDLPPYVSMKINFIDKNENKIEPFKLRDVPKEELNKVIKMIEELFEKFIQGKINTEILSHEIFNEEMKRPDLGHDTLRHLQQASSMIGILKARNFINSNTIFIDLGAGRGSLSYWLTNMIKSEKLEHSKVMVVDRASVRFKRDNKVDDRSLVDRIKVDIGDLDLSKIEMGECKTIIGVSKHLCGGGTDLAINCLLNSPQTQGLLICVCCHHQITYNTFIGRDWLHTNGIDRRIFEIIIKLNSWCISGDGRSREARKEEGLTEDHERRKEMEEIGWKCKRLLDYARVEFLRAKGFEANLSYYVDKKFTLENVCIVANRKGEGEGKEEEEEKGEK